jgi:hyperosmotically inducible periplasmic protein
MKLLTPTLSILLTGSLLTLTGPVPLAAASAVAQAGQTADEQSQTKADLSLAQRIRQAIVKDKALSVDAHNCKVITQQGHVRLRGPVASEDEKTRVEAIATKIAGSGKVTNELTIKSR